MQGYAEACPLGFRLRQSLIKGRRNRSDRVMVFLRHRALVTAPEMGPIETIA